MPLPQRLNSSLGITYRHMWFGCGIGRVPDVQTGRSALMRKDISGGIVGYARIDPGIGREISD